MSELNLFPRDRVVGIFRGFSQGGLEFHADIILPYRNEFQSTPMHGQFLLVQLANEEEAVLGRITSFFSDGRLASGAGEDYSIRVVKEDRVLPEDLREDYLKYRVNIRVLGVVRKNGCDIVFAASHRRLPHVGSKVAFLSEGVLRELAGHNNAGADLGFFALGEFIYAAADSRLAQEAWMRTIQPAVVTKFDIRHLVARRTFIFARAGFGKSNLTKLLFSNLYKQTPTVTKRGDRQVPVGTVIFDPDGEYFWPDDKHRPGLCDVPELQDKVVVFTRRQAPSDFYGSFVAGDIKLDIRRLRPADVISIALSPEKQDQQNVRKLKGLRTTDWEELVNEIDEHGNLADLATIKRLLHLDEERGDVEAVAARSNMTSIVRMLHDRGSQMMDMLIAALKAGKLCVVDVSQLRGGPALILSGLILQRIFDTNQEEFTKARPETIPTIAVIEEAQSVLGGSHLSGDSPYVTWVKEGRKYDLGAVMITQQPGSISTELLSQGDNWFIFHLLSSFDLQAVRKANAHFSEDLLSALLNEPIPGHGIFWSSAGGKQYPIPLRALSFERMYAALDPTYSRPAVKTYAAELRDSFANALAAAVAAAPEVANEAKPPAAEDSFIEELESLFSESPTPDENEPSELPVDAIETYRRQAIQKLRNDNAFMEKLRGPKGQPWKAVSVQIESYLPSALHGRADVAHQLVARAMDEIFGRQNWVTERRSRKSGPGETTWIITNSTARGVGKA